MDITDLVQPFTEPVDGIVRRIHNRNGCQSCRLPAASLTNDSRFNVNSRLFSLCSCDQVLAMYSGQ